MKTTEQLGISPTPWSVDDRNNIVTSDGHTLAVTMVSDAYGHDRTKKDASLIKTAPKLYKCLREAIFESCYTCNNRSGHTGWECTDAKNRCFVKKWRDVLAEAAGEEVTK